MSVRGTVGVFAVLVVAAIAPGPGVPAVGALFTVDANGLTGHYCTASVVDSPQGDLVLTAAHCINDNGDPTIGESTVVGVIGGYQEGGDTPQVSYSSYFDADISHLYDTAIG